MPLYYKLIVQQVGLTLYNKTTTCCTTKPRHIVQQVYNPLPSNPYYMPVGTILRPIPYYIVRKLAVIAVGISDLSVSLQLNLKFNHLGKKN